MSHEIAIETVPSHVVAGIVFSTTLATLPGDMTRTIGELHEQASDPAITVIGPVIAVYPEEMRAEGSWRCEICVPVSEPLLGHPVLTTRELPGGRVATVTHEGAYDGLKDTYNQIFDWFSAHGHTYAGPPREIYLNSPAEVAEKDLRTRIEFPVIPAQK